MSASNIAPKDYQLDALKALSGWLEEVHAIGDPNLAFYKCTNRAYQPVQGLADVPYACLRVPTGGGKTLIAAHGIGRAVDALRHTDSVCVVWLVPSTAILDQTVRALKDPNHGYHQAVAERFGQNVRAMTVAEALYAGPAEYDGGATIIVSTIQSFRQDEIDTLNVYKDNGALMDHFSALDPAIRGRLEPGPGGMPLRSLANALKLRRPMVVVDEAHNARTPLSFVTLARLDPSLIVELSATPAADSNVLHHVSAAELKDEAMIKLPIILRGDPDWKETLRMAKAQLEELAEAARIEGGTGRDFVRPVMLIQAQAARGPAPVTPAIVKKALIEDFQVHESEIRLATGSNWELDNVDFASPSERVRFVITVQALKEGWDCPNAYVLCSIAEQQSSTAVEQMLGRVMRLPGAKRKRDERLNQAYAFAATSSFRAAATALAEGLVANGFNPIEAKALVRAPAPLPGMLEPQRIESDAIEADFDLAPIAKQVAAVTGGRVRLDPVTRRFSATEVTKVDAGKLQLTVPAALGANLNAFLQKFEAAPEKQKSASAEPFSVPLLCVRNGEQLEIFDQSHFLDRPWALEACDAKAIIAKFVTPTGDNREAVIDVKKESGKVDFSFVERLHTELALAIDDHEWPYPRLVQWLDRRLAGAKGQDVTQGSAQAFIKAGLSALMEAGHTLQDLRRLRFRLIEPFVQLIAEYRAARAKDAYETNLFGTALKFDWSPEIATIFDPATYFPIKPFEGYTGGFTKHIRPDLIGDMNGAEVTCADAIQNHPNVRTWVRLIEIPSSFRLRVATQWFYPDFAALLLDGTVAIIEYKGAGTEGPKDRTDEKEAVGKLWAQTTGHRFVMAKDKDYASVQRALSA